MTAVTKLLAVAAGGAGGASLRYLLGVLFGTPLGRDFPHHTLWINVLGSLLIGAALIWLPEHRVENEFWRLAIITGLLGGFTTFSAFSLQTLVLLQHGETLKASLNVLLSVALCLAAAWLGWTLARLAQQSF